MSTIEISQAQKDLYRREGYMILERAIPEFLLDLLRSQCQQAIDRMDTDMDTEGTDTIGINHRGSRYFISNCFREQPALRAFLFSELMADICRATLGDNAYLFWEQYVIKGAENGMKFSWHQDSGYVNYPDHKPYLTCWCALDDMSEANGTVHLLPFSRSGIRSWVQHIVEEGSNDKVGYFGSDPGITIEVPAGSIVAFTSLNFHSSGTNTTNRMRRVYLAQYSPEPIRSADGSRLWGNAEPLLLNGVISAYSDTPEIAP